MSKLILILALSVISLCRPFAAKRRPSEALDPTSLYYFAEQMDDYLNVSINVANEKDEQEYTGKVQTNTLKPLYRTQKTTDASFQVFTDTKAAELEAFQELYQEEKSCGLVYDYYTASIYTFLGYAAYSYSQGTVDIAPSITGLIANSPNYITYTDPSIPPLNLAQYKSCQGAYDADVDAFYQYDEVYTSFAIEKYGILDFECVPNNETWGVPQAPIAPITQTCPNASTTYQSALKGYRLGNAFDQNASQIKDLILRFGPVILVVNDEFGIDYMIVIGWKKVDDDDSWVALGLNDLDQFFVTPTTISDYATLNDVIVVFNVNDLDKCIGKSDQTTKDDCPCPVRNTQEWNEDPRHIEGGICASGSMRAAWAVVVAVLIIPAISLFL